MSVTVMSLVFEFDMPNIKTDDGYTVPDSTAKFVLLALADHAGEDGENAYIGIRRICKKTSMSTSTVCNAINALRHNGFIELVGKSKKDTNNYTIILDRFQLPKQDDSSHRNPSVSATETKPSLNHQLTKGDSLSEKDIKQVNAKVDAIIANSAKATWQGRETFRPDHYPLVDWYNRVTGQECPKSKQKDWHRAVSDWAANNLTVADLQAAYDMDVKWRGVFTSPNQLTDKAIALKAQKQSKPQEMTRLL